MMNKKKICVLGMGYVGLPLSVALSKYYDVFGFDYNSERISELLSGKDKNQIIVEGHSDNDPIPKKYLNKYPSNWELSSARSAAVVKYLIDNGVNPSRLVSHGYAARWPANMTWADMRRGHILKPVGENVKIVKGRGGRPEYTGVDKDENGELLFDKPPGDVHIKYGYIKN